MFLLPCSLNVFTCFKFIKRNCDLTIPSRMLDISLNKWNMFKSNVLLMLIFLLLFFLKINHTLLLVYPYKTLALKNIFFLLHCKAQVAYFILKSRPDVRVVFCLNCRWWCAAVRRLSLRRTRSGGQCGPSARNSCHRRWCSGPFLSLRTRNDPSARRQQARTTTATITRTVRPCTECHYKRIFFS